MSGEITNSDLNTLAERLEFGYRREIDSLRTDVMALRTDIREQNIDVQARLTAVEHAASLLRENARILTHDFKAHLDGHELFAALLKTVKPQPAPLSFAKPNKAIVAGIITLLIALAGVADVTIKFLTDVVHRLKP